MGLFNRKKKEIEFNYEEMMANATETYLCERDNQLLIDLVKSNRFSFLTKTHEDTLYETNYIGVYNKDNKLLLMFEIDLDKLILLNYLVKYTNISDKLSVLYKKIDMQPIKNIELKEDLLSNYSITKILYIILRNNWSIFPNGITSDYVETAIKMYCKNNQ